MKKFAQKSARYFALVFFGRYFVGSYLHKAGEDLKIAVVEDEDVFAEKLTGCVEGFFGKRGDVTEICRFEDGAPLLEVYGNGGGFDLIFLDIQLKTDDGMDIAGRIREYDGNAGVIFVTGLENRAAEGYAVEAFDYIVKSRLEERLGSVLERYLKRLGEGNLTIMTASGGRAVIPFREIYAVESSGRGALLHTVSGKVDANMAVGKIAGLLPGGRYFEVHKGVYVRVEEIRSVDSDRLKMRDGSVFPVSRRRRKPLLEEILRVN